MMSCSGMAASGEGGPLLDALLSCDVCEHRWGEVTDSPDGASCPSCGSELTTVEQERPWGTR